MKMEQTECSETSAYKIQTPGNNPKESIQHSGHGEILKSRTQYSCFKRILKFTLKHLLHVSVQSPSSGSVLFELAKVTVIKIII